MFKVKFTNTRTRCEICSELTIKTLVALWCLYCQLWTYFIPCSSVSIVNCEQLNACCIAAYLWFFVMYCTWCLWLTWSGVRVFPTSGRWEESLNTSQKFAHHAPPPPPPHHMHIHTWKNPPSRHSPLPKFYPPYQGLTPPPHNNNFQVKTQLKQYF